MDRCAVNPFGRAISFSSSLLVKMAALRLIWSAAIVVTVTFQLAGGHYAVRRIDNPPDCPSIYCGWNCARFIDGRGCVFCGLCYPTVDKCPRNPTCPVDSFNVCEMRVGPDGCWTCICKRRPRRPAYLPAYKTVEKESPVSTVEPPRTPPPPPNDVRLPKLPVCEGPEPMCASDCVIRFRPDGCQTCYCRKRKICGEEICKAGCGLEKGADGCSRCRCPETEVAACKEVACDLDNCAHVVDRSTGCAIACECNNSSAWNSRRP